MYIPNMPRTKPAENTFKLCSHAFTSHAMPLSREDDNNLDTVSGDRLCSFLFSAIFGNFWTVSSAGSDKILI